MNDEELITLVREQRTKVPMTAPVNEIISRGRVVRARRRIPGLAGALAAVAGAAVAVTTLVPAGHQPPRQPDTQLAAWTVTRRADGDINVSISQLRDLSGLQATLRADGLPAHVSLSAPPLAPGCRAYPLNPSLLHQVYQSHPGDQARELVINPQALPADAGVYIFGVKMPGPAPSPSQSSAGGQPPPAGAPFAVGVSLVRASRQCTGS
jgi:hypothetical protein